MIDTNTILEHDVFGSESPGGALRNTFYSRKREFWIMMLHYFSHLDDRNGLKLLKNKREKKKAEKDTNYDKGTFILKITDK